ncbi:defensin Tk-AMP-D1-like [Prunus yedoensis var. nudiflora]|uniref:Defensin Tk-AMP-D1-like n=1 Tax=Prunus yedoensis var. nudiflora TaxID=2094558 RepID=A0A314UM77_PRUYE|nr:defensin Tk-AMP-D1-like [Prunus yedoensis var. nudiflora]
MAKSVGSSTTIVLLIAFLLIASLAVPVVEAKGGRGCKQASKMFLGPCKDHPECNKKCREAEKAKSGLCRSEGTKGKKCYCYMC